MNTHKRIELENASFGYGRRTVLSGVNLLLEEGDICLIKGPNGSGKTTLALGIIGLLPLMNGQRRFNFSTPAYVPQAGRFDAQYPITIAELVAMGIDGYASMNPFARWRRREAHKKMINESLMRCGIANISSKIFSRVSGGEFQRALIARSLVSNPDILVLDEPFANIDRRGKAGIKELLLEENARKGTTLVLIDHHENVDFCSKCFEIAEGRVIENGNV